MSMKLIIWTCLYILPPCPLAAQSAVCARVRAMCRHSTGPGSADTPHLSVSAQVVLSFSSDSQNKQSQLSVIV